MLHGGLPAMSPFTNTRLGGGAGRTQTSNQSVMEYGRVRPAHLVGHQASSSNRAAIDGHSTKGKSSVAVTHEVRFSDLSGTMLADSPSGFARSLPRKPR